jgi:hypothetical protein
MNEEKRVRVGMSKVIIEFNLPEEQEEFQDALNGTKNAIKFSEVWEKLFRPRHKHGYNNSKLQDLIDSSPQVGEALDILEELYQEINGRD